MDYSTARARRNYERLKSYGMIDSEMTFEAYELSRDVESDNKGARILSSL
jgi:hypothetical protein